MRIALVHNRYKQPGGEDVAVDFEDYLLRSAGHVVFRRDVSNGDAIGGGRLAQLQGAAMTAVQSRWNLSAAESARDWASRCAADVAHVHNWFPLLSPSVYQGLREAGSAVVQTLHNYRLLCAGATLYREGAVCTDCVGRSGWRGVLRGCYRGSTLQSAAWWRVMRHGRTVGAFGDLVDAYIAPSAMVADLHAQAGLPRDRIYVVPNAVADPGRVPPPTPDGPAVFIGRLTEEKGVRALVEAWVGMSRPLEIIGDGPLRGLVEQASRQHPSIRCRGRLPHAEAMETLSNSAFLVFPSTWLEPFGLTMIEAMACGRPVLAFANGAAPEIVTHGQDGWLVRDPTPQGLAAAVHNAWRSVDRIPAMSAAARETYERRFAPAPHVRGLMRVFKEALATRGLASREGARTCAA